MELHGRRFRLSLWWRLLGFGSAYLLALFCHQCILALLAGLGPFPFGDRSLGAIRNEAQILSLAVWGGAWGYVWATIANRMVLDLRSWAAGLVLGSLVSACISWSIVAPKPRAYLKTEKADITVETLARGLEHPWGL